MPPATPSSSSVGDSDEDIPTESMVSAEADRQAISAKLSSAQPFSPTSLRPNLHPRPELADALDPVAQADQDSTAEIAANAPRYRRKSSTFIDGIHDVTNDGNALAPAQLYSTMSGRLFHSGRIVIVMVGLPARGKTHICVSMARYLSWLGVKTRIFHLGDYRRATVPGGAVPDDYFFPHASPSSVMLRQKILKKCREDIYAWLNHENGQVAIYDAVNPTASGRRSLAKEFSKHDVQVRQRLLSKYHTVVGANGTC